MTICAETCPRCGRQWDVRDAACTNRTRRVAGRVTRRAIGRSRVARMIDGRIQPRW